MIAIGNTNITKAYLGQTELANIAIGDKLLLSSEPTPLPYDAVEVEYLQSSGTQYINTGLKVNNSYTFDTSIAALNNAATTYWGCRNSGSYNTRNQQCYLQNNPAAPATSTIHLWTDSTEANYRANSWDSGIAPAVGTMYHFSGITVNTNLAQLTQPITLFAFNVVGTINKSSCRIGLFKAYSNGTVVMDMIPVRVGATGYMYDKVSQTLFGNAGTGDFILGNDIT